MCWGPFLCQEWPSGGATGNQTALKGQKWPVCGHKLAWRLKTGVPRLDQLRAHPWRWVGAISRVWNVHQGTPYGSKGPFGLFMASWPFLALLDHDGHSEALKTFQHIASNVPGLDPTLIHADPPVWSRQASLWPQNDHLWPFWTILGPYGAPLWPFRTRERVPTHRPGCGRT